MNRALCRVPLLALAACGGAPELPEPPASEATDAILAEYESPSGTVDAAQLDDTLERVRLRLDELDIAYLPKLIAELLTVIGRRLDSSSLPSDPTETTDTGRAVITGVVELERVCPGWADPEGPPAADQNGSLEVTAIFEKSRLNSRIWGTATQCRESLTLGDAPALLPSIHVLIDGTLIIDLYGALPRAATDAEFWVGFSGALGREADVRDVMFDFRVVAGRVEFRHPVADGNIIIGVGLTSLEMRSAGVSFHCDLATSSCQPI